MRTIILTPVYNDWESFVCLLADLKTRMQGHEWEVVAIDDASSATLHPDRLPPGLPPVTVVQLNTNLGHQRAIATGLAFIHDRGGAYDAIVVMDSDGEDKPSDIPGMLSCFERCASSRIVFAQRVKRSESLRFRLLYRLYKQLFRFLTGQKISFGNFSCLPRHLADRVVYNADAWNHFSGCILKAGLPYETHPTHRGTRYSGTSRMNTANLMLHGLSSISVYMDQISMRLLATSFAGAFLGLLALCVTFAIRLFTPFAIPGWATYVSLMLLNAISLMFVLSLLGLMLRLSGRSTMQLPPAKLYKEFILATRQANA